jgi:hypothetical protein
VNGTIATREPVADQPQQPTTRSPFRVELEGTLGGGRPYGDLPHGRHRPLTQIARLGQTVPGNDGKLLSFSPIDLNDAGKVAFFSDLERHDRQRSDLRRRRRRPQRNRPHQETAPGREITFQVLDLGRVALNESGQVMFSGTGTDESQQQVQGLFRGDGDDTATIAQQGTSVPAETARTCSFPRYRRRSTTTAKSRS